MKYKGCTRSVKEHDVTIRGLKMNLKYKEMKFKVYPHQGISTARESLLAETVE